MRTAAVWLRAVVAVAACAIGVGLLVPTSPAEAQRKKRKSSKVIRLKEIRIEGRVQKPNAFYILNRSRMGYLQSQKRKSFVVKIVKAVEEEPF